MTLTLNTSASDEFILEFITQTLSSNKIHQISNEKEIVDNQINIKRTDYNSCVQLLYLIGKQHEKLVTIKNEPNNIIVLYK